MTSHTAVSLTLCFAAVVLLLQTVLILGAISTTYGGGLTPRPQGNLHDHDRWVKDSQSRRWYRRRLWELFWAGVLIALFLVLCRG